ncbi:MAG: ROK family protein [Lachnospiraceae bacterium]|nr:ROK family protein [Lachnospiraceae bacterium]
MGYYLILDIGGTKTTGALFSEEGRPVKDLFIVAPSKTYEGCDAVFDNTVSVGREVLEKTGVEAAGLKGIGAAAPGPLDYNTGVIINVPLMGWKDFPLGPKLEKEFGVPVRLDNDGNLGALAEQRLGVAEGASSVVYMTVSTGCGGGIVINGEVYRGFTGSAGELGHMSIDINGIPCNCGANGCLELYASGTAMNRRMLRDMKNGVKSLAFEEIAYDPERISGKILGNAAEAGDEYALAFLQEEGRYLGAGLANYFNLFDPEVFVLGGGITHLKKWFYGEMMRTIERCAVSAVSPDRVRFSELNDKVVVYGAYCLISEYTDTVRL